MYRSTLLVVAAKKCGESSGLFTFHPSPDYDLLVDSLCATGYIDGRTTPDWMQGKGADTHTCRRLEVRAAARDKRWYVDVASLSA